ncbi:MAG: hypothetical protein QXQ53_01160 [Candidatus Methanosuratincola sp.]
MKEKKVHIKGFSRIVIAQDGKIVGDSGWVGPNTITNQGFLNFLVKTLGGSSGSSQVGYMALGTGGAPSSGDTTLAGEIMGSTKRKAVTFTNVGSTTAQFTATWASSESFVTTTYNISNVGLFATTNTNATLFAGNTYASSQLNTNQDVYATYQIRFS